MKLAFEWFGVALAGRESRWTSARHDATEAFYYINDKDLANSIVYLKTIPAVSWRVRRSTHSGSTSTRCLPGTQEVTSTRSFPEW